MLNGVSIGEIAIYVVVVGAIIAIAYRALLKYGIAIPSFIVEIFWIVVVAIIAIFAIKIVLHLLA